MSKVLILDKDNFEDELFNNSGSLLIEFWSTTCKPCQSMMPILEEIAIYFSDRISIAKFNVAEDIMIANAYSVRSVPSFLLFKNGKIIDRFVGTKSKDGLIKFIESNI